MPKVQPRDISPLLQMFRNFLLGREHVSALRHEEFVASRSPPLPELPDGPCHKLNNNYYFSRDVRREVNPPILIAADKTAIVAAGGPAEEASAGPKLVTPGKIHNWD